MIVFGSRGSDLALTQTRWVAERLQQRVGVDFRIEVIETKGDRNLSQPLPEIGGKGLFTAELETALRDGSIDVAVHSLKDLPVADPEGITVAAIPARAAVHDVLVCHPDAVDETAESIPLRRGASVGTSSLRRAGALRLLRPDLEFRDVRGNVPTRVDKVRRRDYGAVVLAAAGLDRLGIEPGELRFVSLPLEACPPAPGQGALGVQCRRDDTRMHEMLGELDDEHAAVEAVTERDLLLRLGGGCSMPLGAAVRREPDGKLDLRAALFCGDDRVGGVFVRAAHHDRSELVERAARELEPLVRTPLSGRDVLLVRPEGVRDELADYLAVAGARVKTVSLTRVEAMAVDPADLAGVPESGAVFAFSSARAVAACMADRRLAKAVPGARVVYAVGARTADALARFGVSASVPDEPAGGERLAAYVLEAGGEDAVVFPCARGRHGAFESALRAAGRRVHPVRLYATVPIEGATLAPDLGGAVVVLASPSSARAFHDAAARSEIDISSLRVVAFGPTTAGGIRELGLDVDATAASTPASLLTAIAETAS